MIVMHDTWQVEKRRIRSIQGTFSSTTAVRTSGPRLENSAVPGLITPCLWCQSSQISRMTVLWIRIASSKLSVLNYKQVGLTLWWSSDVFAYLVFALRKEIRPHGQILTPQTPPEGWVRAKKILITFDTNFWSYLPRGTKFGGSRKCGIGAFCTIAKKSDEIWKKCSKMGLNFFHILTYVR